MPDDWDALILAGGKGERLGGVDKATLVVGGRQLIDHVLSAVAGARAAVQVGGPRTDGVRWTVEEPAGGGPAAAVIAGLDELRRDADHAPWTVVLAVDTPGAASAVPGLLTARDDVQAGRADGAHLVDEHGHAQHLIAVYRTESLQAAALQARPSRAGARASAGAPPTSASGVSMRTLVGGLTLVPVADRDDAAHDLDTWEDVHFWKERLG